MKNSEIKLIKDLQDTVAFKTIIQFIDETITQQKELIYPTLRDAEFNSIKAKLQATRVQALEELKERIMTCKNPIPEEILKPKRRRAVTKKEQAQKIQDFYDSMPN